MHMCRRRKRQEYVRRWWWRDWCVQYHFDADILADNLVPGKFRVHCTLLISRRQCGLSRHNFRRYCCSVLKPDWWEIPMQKSSYCLLRLQTLTTATSGWSSLSRDSQKKCWTEQTQTLIGIELEILTEHKNWLWSQPVNKSPRTNDFFLAVSVYCSHIFTIDGLQLESFAAHVYFSFKSQICSIRKNICLGQTNRYLLMRFISSLYSGAVAIDLNRTRRHAASGSRLSIECMPDPISGWFPIFCTPRSNGQNVFDRYNFFFHFMI